MQVTYFHRNHPNIDTRSMSAELIDKNDAVHKDLTKILNLEMKLLNSLESEFREDDNTYLVTGSATMYPGLEPYIGDLFYLEIDNNNIHLFRVNDVKPTTYRQERYYTIQFSTYTQATPEVYARLNSDSLNTMVFDKRSYFGSSEYSLLTYDSWFVLKKLRQLRKAIAQDLVNFFFDSSNQTFLRPDKIYDPYVVEYLKAKIVVADSGVRPVQLYPRLDNYHQSIWYKLTDSANTLDMSDICFLYLVYNKKLDMFDSDMNGLMELRYLILTETTVSQLVTTDPNNVNLPRPQYDIKYFPDLLDLQKPSMCYHDGYLSHQEATYDKTTYLLSRDFYNSYITNTNSLEYILHDWLFNNNLDSKKIMLLTEKYRKFKKSDNNTFYTYCFYLALIDAAIIRLTE